LDISRVIKEGHRTFLRGIRNIYKGLLVLIWGIFEALFSTIEMILGVLSPVFHIIMIISGFFLLIVFYGSVIFGIAYLINKKNPLKVIIIGVIIFCIFSLLAFIYSWFYKRKRAKNLPPEMKRTLKLIDKYNKYI